MPDPTPNNNSSNKQDLEEKMWGRLQFAINDQLCDETGELDDIKGRVKTCLKHHKLPPKAIKVSLDSLPKLAGVRPDKYQPKFKAAFIKPGAKQVFRTKIVPLLDLDK